MQAVVPLPAPALTAELIDSRTWAVETDPPTGPK